MPLMGAHVDAAARSSGALCLASSICLAQYADWEERSRYMVGLCGGRHFLKMKRCSQSLRVRFPEACFVTSESSESTSF
jgi:hypothetical protein